MGRTEANNPLCPDFSSHWENAFDILYPTGRTSDGRKSFQLTAEEDDAVVAAAEIEYLNCEGH